MVAGQANACAAGLALVAGGGLRMGQLIGATDRRGERATGRPYTPQNLLATMYHVRASTRRGSSRTIWQAEVCAG